MTKLFSTLLATTSLAVLMMVDVAEAQTVPTISSTYVDPTGFNTGTSLQNASNTMYFSNDGETLFIVRGGTTAVTATFKTQATSMFQNGYGSVSLSDQTLSIPSGTVVVAGPFPTARWNNPYGLVGVSLTAPTGVSASAVRLPQ